MNIIDALRQYRMGPFAFFDFTAAYLGMLVVTPLLKKIFLRFHLLLPTVSVLWFVLPLSILVHILIGKYTALTTMFLDPTQYYTVKVIIIIMMAKGVMGIKKAN